MTTTEIRDRLESLRGELRAERISYGELLELQSLAEHIEPGDVELLEAAGVPEHDADRDADAEHRQDGQREADSEQAERDAAYNAALGDGRN